MDLPFVIALLCYGTAFGVLLCEVVKYVPYKKMLSRFGDAPLGNKGVEFINGKPYVLLTEEQYQHIRLLMDSFEESTDVASSDH